MMTISPTIRASLLLRLRDPSDHEAWVEFVALYEPVVYRVLRRADLQDADAQEVSPEDAVETGGSQLMKRRLSEIKAIHAANLLIEQLSEVGLAGAVQIVADEKTNCIEASGDSAALKLAGEYLDRIESEAVSSKDRGDDLPKSDQPARAASDRAEEPANGLPTPEAAARALIRAYAERNYELFLKARLRTVCETNDKDGPSKYADALHFSQLMRGKDQLTVYDLQRRLKPDSIRAVAANSSRDLTHAIETALQFYGEEYRYVDVTSDGFDGSQYVIRVIVARNGNQWYAIPHGYSSENAYEAVNASAQATEETPAK